MNDFDPQFGLEPVFPPCKDVDINVIENTLGGKFPDDYRLFILKYNGATFSEQPAFPLSSSGPAGSAHGSISRLYGIAPNATAMTTDHLIREQYGYEFRERVPKNIIAIGRNIFHQRICLSIGGDDHGAVYLWDPGVDWEDQPNVPTTKYLRPVSKTFSAFWDSLCADPENIE